MLKFDVKILVAIFYLFISCEHKDIEEAKGGVVNLGNTDTTKVNNLNTQSEELWRRGSYDSALVFAHQAKKTAQDLKYDKGLMAAYNNIGVVHMFESNYSQALQNFYSLVSVANRSGNHKKIAGAYNNIGLTYVDLGEYQRALEVYYKGLKVYQQAGDKRGIANVYGNIGVVYDNQGNYPEAINNYLAALKIFEEIDYKTGIANSYNNIGDCYNNQGKYNEALMSHKKSLEIKKKINDKPGIASSNTNIGLTYDYLGRYDDALRHYDSSLNMYKELGDDWGMGLIYNNIGAVLANNKKYDEAMKSYFTGLKIRETIDDKEGIANSCNNIGSLFTLLKKYDEAYAYLKRSLVYSTEIGSMVNTRDSYEYLSKLDSLTGNFKDAYYHFKQSVLFKDSMLNKENTEKIVQQQMQYEFDKKTAVAKTEQEKKDAVTKSEKQKQYLILLFVVIGLVLVIIFSLFIYNRFRVTQKQKGIIETQKKEVEEQRHLADARRLIAEEQKHVIEEKQKEILDSIHYAKRIQGAMLTSEEYISKHFLAEYFIFYQPKDIVSGDFYWAVEHNKKFYIATADCTGHGVPGAFMSLLNINFLSANILEKDLVHPSLILNEQRKSIIKALNPTGTENSKDGMDCVLCCFDLSKKTLEFAAANNPLWLIRDNTLIEYKADKMPVGKYDENEKDFSRQTINLNKGDIIYTFTDGFADQFGGPKGKKFKYKQLEELLISICQEPMSEQKSRLQKTINEWKGDLEQVDDILVIGIRI